MKRTVTFLLLVGFISLSGSLASAKDESFGICAGQAGVKGLSRGIYAEHKIRNDRPVFVVRIDVDHADRVYEDRDLIKATVVSEKAGYLYLLSRMANKKLVCLFPNKYERDNRISAREKLVVPGTSDDFNLRVGAPFGTEALIAIVSTKPLMAKNFGVKSLTDNFPTPVDTKSLIDKVINVEGRNNRIDPKVELAEHHVILRTVSQKSQVSGRRNNRRVGLFIGISDYAEARNLRVCHSDAIAIYEIMKKCGKLEGGRLLTNKDATLANIRDAIKSLIESTKPGDEVFIYWSGHGARCADENGDEKDGYDEYLVPYDFRMNDPNTRLVDDEFGRIIQDFDGRRVVVILDTCHSGGLSEATKGLTPPGGYFDFIDNELARTKDIGQKDAAMLCSSDSHEISVERREGDLSVMTYFLCKKIDDDNRVTLADAYSYVRDKVPAYISERMPGLKQTPILVNKSGTIYLRP